MKLNIPVVPYTPPPFLASYQSLLELAVKTSSAATDPMSDNLAFEMDPRSVMELARCGGKYGDTRVADGVVCTHAQVHASPTVVL